MTRNTSCRNDHVLGRYGNASRVERQDPAHGELNVLMFDIEGDGLT